MSIYGNNERTLENCEKVVGRLLEGSRKRREKIENLRVQVDVCEQEIDSLHLQIGRLDTRLTRVDKLIAEVDCGMTLKDSESDRCAGCDNWVGEDEGCWFARLKEAFKNA